MVTPLVHALGVDLGATKIEMGIVDQRGMILDHLRIPTSPDGPDVVQKELINGIKRLLNQNNVQVNGIGIGVAGQIESNSGEVIFAPNLKWQHIPLQGHLQSALNLPTFVSNDVRAITWGEWKYGAGKNSQDLICLFVGTGISAGIVSNGTLLSGCTNTLGEVGHMTIDLNGPLCTCGNIGCFESIAGGWGIAERAKEAIKTQNHSTNCLLNLADGSLEKISAKSVVEAYRLNDPLATELMGQVEKALIAGCVSLINAFNPCLLILGGGVIDGVPELITQVQKNVPRLALKAATRSLDIVGAKLGKQVGVIGSAAIVFDGLNKAKGN